MIFKGRGVRNPCPQSGSAHILPTFPSSLFLIESDTFNMQNHQLTGQRKRRGFATNADASQIICTGFNEKSGNEGKGNLLFVATK